MKDSQHKSEIRLFYYGLSLEEKREFIEILAAEIEADQEAAGCTHLPHLQRPFEASS